VLVGAMMLAPLKDLDTDDTTEVLPAFLTMVMMPLTYSIAEGIVWGLTSYVLLKVLSRKAKSVSIATYIVAAVFILKFFI